MPVVKASMKDISTDFNPVEPGVHIYQIESVEEAVDPESGRTHYIIKQKIVALAGDGGDPKDVGRSVTTRIHIHKKDGTQNDIGLAQLKKYFEITVGEEQANSDEADTDWLLGQSFKGQTVTVPYKTMDQLTQQEVTRYRNEIARFATA